MRTQTIRHLALAVALGISTHSCGGTDPAWTPLPASSIALNLVPGDGDAVVDCSWDGGAPVPVESLERTANSMRIEFGGTPLTPQTTLYVAGSMQSSSGQPSIQRGRVLEAEQLSAIDGRWGDALRLGPASTLKLVGERELFPQAGWSVGFWFRPDATSEANAGALFSAGESLRIELDDSLQLVLYSDCTEEPTTLARSLTAGDWFSISVVFDRLRSPRFRVYVNAQFAGEVRLEGTLSWPNSARVGRTGDRAGIRGAIDQLWIREYAMNQSELEELLRPGDPGEHQLEWSMKSGAEDSARIWTGVQPASRIEGDAAWKLGQLEHLAVVSGGLRWAPAHWSRDFAPDRPTARTTHPTVFVGDHRAFVFSGEVRDSHLGGMSNVPDTWIYKIDEKRWTRIGSRAKPSLDEDTRGPRGSCHRPMAWSREHGLVLAVGGWRNDVPGAYEAFDETWVYHVDEERWELRHPSGDAPPALSDFGLVYHERLAQFILLQGGQVYAYDPVSDHWTKYPWSKTLDGITGERLKLKLGGSFMCGYDPLTENVILFGGEWNHPDVQFYNHTFKWNHRTNYWTRLYPSQSPSARVRSGFAYSPSLKAFVLFGGVRDQFSERLDDLWIYRPAENEWIELDSSNTPSGRGGFYGMAHDPELDLYSLLCGRHDVQRFLDEAWSLTLDFESTGEAIYVFDRNALPTADRAWVSWVGGAGATIELDFCDAVDLHSFGNWSSESKTPGASAQRFLKLRVRVHDAELNDPPVIKTLGLLEPGEEPVGEQRVVIPIPE